MSPEEFDAACRAIWRRVPELSETSGRRSVSRNKNVNGSPNSKHVLGMAQDFAGPPDALKHGASVARILGLWYQLHDVGSGNHLHVQGLPPGAVPDEWREQYMEDEV